MCNHIYNMSNKNIVSETFIHNNANVYVIKDNNNNNWYNGEDIASILKYENKKKAFIKYVDDEYKKYYYELEKLDESKKLGKFRIDPEIIFIDESGLFQLVSRSKKPEAVKLWRKITKEILPELFATGTYTLPSKESDDKLNKSPHDEYIKTINNWEHKYELLNVKYENSLKSIEDTNKLVKIMEKNNKNLEETNKLLKDKLKTRG
uniref:Bro-n domain-containing protein n=1 Tax=Borely moumouvirus TaxID=2712067 RepID=A0A6G6ABH8_9VIRU